MKPRMLVVDEDGDLSELYRLELEDEGYNVELAGTASAALEKLQYTGYDVVILDIRMPGMPGIDLLRRVIARDRQQSVILNTSYSYYRQNYRAWSAAAYVVKSHSTIELKQAIRNALAAKS